MGFGNRKPVALLRGHDSAVVGAAFSPDGRRVATASWDGTARVWGAADGTPIGPPFDHDKPVLAVAFSPDGRQILTVSDDRTSRLVDLASHQVVLLDGHEDVIRSGAFSPDGGLAVTASFDKSARIWNARTGDENAVLRGHRKAVTAAVFSTDGHRIVTASDDASGQVWATFKSTQALVDFARSILPRELTPEERKAFFLDPAAAVQPGR